MGRGQQSLDDLGEGVGRFVALEGCAFFGSRRQADQVKGGSTDKVGL
jgi:hypothetical protein